MTSEQNFPIAAHFKGISDAKIEKLVQPELQRIFTVIEKAAKKGDYTVSIEPGSNTIRCLRYIRHFLETRQFSFSFDESTFHITISWLENDF